MKYLKLFTVLLGAAALTACSNKDEAPKINTASGVEVSMGQSELTLRENRGIVEIPVQVTGNTNGIVTVTCQVKEVGSTPAMDDVHYLFTSKTINIEKGATEAYFEVRLVDDRIENETRSFVVSIVDVQGATVGGINQTYVDIEDNDKVPYERMGGEWLLMIDGGVQGTVRFNDADKGKLGYDEYYNVTGLISGASLQGDFSWDEKNHVATITFNFGDRLVNYDGEDINAIFCYVSPDMMDIIANGSIVFKWYADEDPDHIVWESSPGPAPGKADFWLLYYPDGGDLSILGYRQNVTGFEADF